MDERHRSLGGDVREVKGWRDTSQITEMTMLCDDVCEMVARYCEGLRWAVRGDDSRKILFYTAPISCDSLQSEHVRRWTDKTVYSGFSYMYSTDIKLCYVVHREMMTRRYLTSFDVYDTSKIYNVTTYNEDHIRMGDLCGETGEYETIYTMHNQYVVGDNLRIEVDIGATDIRHGLIINLVSYGSTNGNTVVYDIKSGSVIHQTTGLRGRYSSIITSPTEFIYCTGNPSNRVMILHDIRSGRDCAMYEGMRFPRRAGDVIEQEIVTTEDELKTLEYQRLDLRVGWVPHFRITGLSEGGAYYDARSYWG